MNGKRDKSPLGLNSRPNSRAMTPMELAEHTQQMMREHSCQSLDVCQDFCNKLVEIIGDKIQMIEIDKLRRPCAAVMSLQAAAMLTAFKLQRPDPNEDLCPDMEGEGAEEPKLIAKESFQQYPAMLRIKSPPTPLLSSDESLKQDQLKSKLRKGRASDASGTANAFVKRALK